MTKSLKIVTDSSVQLTPEEIEEYDISIIPLAVDLAGENYLDGVNIQREELITALENKTIPKTSQPAIGSIIEVFEQLTADGSPVLAIMMTDVISGTYQTAVTAANMVDGDVTVINSKSTDRGLGFQVIAAAQDARAGKSIEEIKKHLKDIHSRTYVDVFVDELDCLIAGGRISRFAGAITKLMNIKVIIHLTDDTLEVATKGRSRKTFYKRCQELIANNPDNRIEQLSLSNVGTDQALLDKVSDLVLANEPDSADIPKVARLTSPIIMSHTGLNAIGLIVLFEKPPVV